MKYIKTIVLVGYLLALTPLRIFAAFETGGTNFINYDLSSYATHPIAANWTKLDYQGGIKTVIGAYDLDPEKVHTQLDAMCQSGQKKVGFMVWHSRFAPYPQTSLFPSQIPDQTYPVDSLGFYTNSIGGKLQPRQENNLRNIVDYIAKKNCFNEIQFRFAPVWYSYIADWGTPADLNQPQTGWQEPVYLENFAFIKFVRNVIGTTLSTNGSTIKAYYDLGAETGGATYEYLVPDSDPDKHAKVIYYRALTEMYQKRLLADYNKEFGVNDTYGFSIALIPGRFTRLMAVYDAIGIRPKQHAVDIYDPNNTGMTSQLNTLYAEIQQAGETTTPIIIQETYYDDQQAFTEIMEAKNRLGLPIRTIMQWQIHRDKMYRPDNTFRHFSTTGSQYRYHGPRGTISCAQAILTVQPGQLGEATITSTTSHIAAENGAQVCVASTAQPMAEMATFRNNANETRAPWIAANTTYTFTLFHIRPNSTCQGEILDSCTVTGIAPAIVSGDLNADGKVNRADYDMLISGYGNTYTIFDYNRLIRQYEH